MLRLPEPVPPLLFDFRRGALRALLVEDVLAMHPRGVRLHVVGAHQALTQLLRNVLQGVELMGTHQVALCMEVRGSVTLVLRRPTEGCHPTEDAAHRPHVVPEHVLAAQITLVTVGAQGAHAHAERRSQPDAHVDLVRLHDGQRVPSASHPPEVVPRIS